MQRDGEDDDTRRWEQELLELALRWGALLSCRRCGAVLVARQAAGEAVREMRAHVCAGRRRPVTQTGAEP